MNNISNHIALVGASGNVGRKILETLSRRAFPYEVLSLFASARSAGSQIEVGGGGGGSGSSKKIKIAALEEADFSDMDLVFFAAGAAVAQEFAPKAAEAGAIVIDNSSHFRMDPDVPLIVPEVNGDLLKGDELKKNLARNIIANPNCSTAQFVTALAPLHRVKKIERVHVATYQSVSGAGRAAMEQLMEDVSSQNPRPSSLAFNVVPKIDALLDNGETKEEWKMRVETAKILDPKIKVSTHCVRVPVLVGHSEAVFIRFAQKMNVAEAKEILRHAPGCALVEEDYATPKECEGLDPVFISRLRQDPADENGIQMWITADNLLKGAALNAVQIAELLLFD